MTGARAALLPALALFRERLANLPVLSRQTSNNLSGPSRCVWGLLCCLSILALPEVTQAQNSSDQDTRLRLDQQIEGQKRKAESRLLENADSLDVPASLEVDGQTYAVGDNINDIGKALYISVARQRWDDARKFLIAYERFPDRDPMLVLFAKGGLARYDGKLRVAENHYRELLSLKADFLPAQLELGRVLFENHKDREARSIFEAARAILSRDGDKAVGVQRTVDTFLAALKRRRGWQGTVAVGPGYSDNLNQSSASYTCLIVDNEGNCLFDRKVPDPIKAAGINFEATLGREIPLEGHNGIRARAILFGDIYPEHHDFSQATVIGRLGYQYQTARNAISFSSSWEAGSLGSALLYDAPGVNAEWTHILSPRALLRVEGNYRNFRYRESSFDAQDGALADVNLTLWRTLSPSWTILGGPDFATKDAGNLVDAYRQWGGRLGINKAFDNSASLFIMGSYRYRHYRAFSELFEAQRKDRMFNATAVARFPALAFVGLVPEIVLQHNRVESNIDWLYSYKRTTASVRLSHVF